MGIYSKTIPFLLAGSPMTLLEFSRWFESLDDYMDGVGRVRRVSHGNAATKAILRVLLGGPDRFCAAPSASSSHPPFESDWAFPTQC